MNYNVGFSAKVIDRTKLTMTINSAAFYRKAENFIRATTGVRRATYINFDAALVRGIEAELKVVAAKKLAVRGTVSYQQVLDDNKFVGGTLENYSYRVQLPNTPSLFGSADVEYKLTGLIGTLNLIPYYSLLYVKEFYLGYENIARGDLKYTIPMQLVHDFGMTLLHPTELYSFSLECSNLTNSLAFDNFRLQKAGRSFNFKITYNIN
jgi:outer membrane receptor protein involved in Fe transport